MPARKRTTSFSMVNSPQTDDPDRDDVAYKLKRQRNNDAVKKTRAKSKETAEVRKQNVEALKLENQKLETQIGERKKTLVLLKDLLLNSAGKSKNDELIKKILEENSDDEENGF